MLYDKSDKHLTIYENYNVECAARMIKKIELSNISDTYSATNMIKLISRATRKNICYGNNMLPGIAMVIPLRQFPTTSIIQCFRSSCSSRTILALINESRNYLAKKNEV